MLSSFMAFLEREKLISNKHQTTLLAVSGGVDSVVLAYLFKKASLPFAMAHCNFNLRGAEAEAAATFVEELAKWYGVPFYEKQFDTKGFASSHKVSLQMAARSLRYTFFHELLNQHGWAQLATAHHWDDAIETILRNFIKGTGIKGFYGIESIHGQIIRPLLFASKKQIIAYAIQEKLDWHEDSSNQSNYYQRNFIRNRLIPVLHQVNPNFETTTQATATKLKHIGQFFEAHLANMKKKLITAKEGLYYLAVHKIINHPWAATVAFELLRPYGFTFEQINNLITKRSTSGKMVHAKDYTLHVDRKNWWISPKSSLPLTPVAIWPTTQSLVYGKHMMHCQIHKQENYVIQKRANIGAFDFDTLNFPLIIRPWQTGDYFYPLGMQGSKKISDFLIDLKIPMATKKQVFVVTSNKVIIWVVGHRIDERFKITRNTQNIFEIL